MYDNQSQLTLRQLVADRTQHQFVHRLLQQRHRRVDQTARTKQREMHTLLDELDTRTNTKLKLLNKHTITNPPPPPNKHSNSLSSGTQFGRSLHDFGGIGH